MLAFLLVGGWDLGVADGESSKCFYLGLQLLGGGDKVVRSVGKRRVYMHEMIVLLIIFQKFSKLLGYY